MEVEPVAVPRPRLFPAEGGPDQAPGPRCGHTLTTITGPDGDINRAKLVLFGGATALEGSTAKNPDGTTSSPASPSPAGIRLAGATNDVHVFDVRTGRWTRVHPAGEPPSPRAAHAAAAVGNMVVVQGGIGPAGLATEDLHVLDFTDPERPRWHRVLVHGAGPSARYAHTLSLVANRFLVALGGNDGRATLGDAWALDTSEKPYAWRKITDAGETPCARMYATAAARSDGLLLLCGGRDAAGVPLADAHGFARHRDGRWEWHAAPGAMPSGRYQHGAVFVGARLHVSGGAVGGGRMVEESSSVVALDTSGGAWCLPPAAAAAGAAGAAAATPAATPAAAGAAASGSSGGGSSAAAEDPARRCRHAAASVGPFVFLYGGLRGSALLDDLLLADDGRGTELACCDPRSAPWSRYLTQAHGSASAAALLAEAAAAEAAAAEALRERSSGSLAGEEAGSPGGSTAAGGGATGAAGAAAAGGGRGTTAAAAAGGGGAITPISTTRAGAAGAGAAAGEAATPTAVGTRAAAGAATGVDARDASPDGVTLLNNWRPPPPGGTPPTPDVRLYHRAVVAPMEPPLRGLVRQLSIDQLDNEGRRVSIYGEKGSPGGGPGGFGSGAGGSGGGAENGGMPARSPLFSRSLSVPGAHKRVISELLRPRQWRPSADGDRRFMLGAEEIVDLCEAAERLFAEEPSVLQLSAPIKIFGDLHGQFGDLMRLFEEYGAPNTAGDITYIDYLFLGDYVDRGSHSLETICLLLALKVEYPRHIHLIRGNHEAADINALFGFRLECLERLGDEDGIWVWKRVNALFNWLPLAALIEGKVLCMHGGIGRCIHRIDQIAELKRPLTMEDGGPVLMDLLWSDPTTNDGVEGVQPSPRGPGLVTFGPDRVKEFCRDNGLQMIVRAHECVMDGFERFAQGHLITLFSATNYCGTAGNAGAILVLGRDLVMVPKLIHPVPPATPRTPDSSAGGDALLADGEEGAGGGVGEGGGAAPAGADTWMTQVNEERPPTPPRGRPHSPGSSLEYF